MYAGIDYSMSCPAITVGNSKDFNKCQSFFFTKVKKHQGAHSHNIFGMTGPAYESEMERFHIVSEWAMTILRKLKVTDAAIEGYAMGGKGRVFQIGENTGLLKHKMWQAGINFRSLTPSAVKKDFSGKGNASKDVMHEAFVNQTKVDIAALFQQNPDSNPVSDIVDSYAIHQYGLKTYF